MYHVILQKVCGQLSSGVSCHYRTASETPFKWCFAGGPIVAHIWMLADFCVKFYSSIICMQERSRSLKRASAIRSKISHCVLTQISQHFQLNITLNGESMNRTYYFYIRDHNKIKTLTKTSEQIAINKIIKSGPNLSHYYLT